MSKRSSDDDIKNKTQGQGVHDHGTPGDDVLSGGPGDDRLDGGKGDDLLLGESGNDRLHGGKGDDVLEGEAGHDRLDGGKGDDRLDGGAGNDRLDGGQGDDEFDGGAGNDRLDGGQGDDRLDGGEGNDWLAGGAGSDRLLGGAGNDVLLGDDGRSGWGGWCWPYKPAGHADYIDGGAGSDLVVGGRGNDLANYAFAENLGARDAYYGGRGFDTLRLTLTHGEAQLASVQQDVDDFQAWLAHNANPLRDFGCSFHFQSSQLDVNGFEALEVVLVNTAPLAGDDAGETDEDTPLSVAAGGVLANDSDADHLDVLAVVDCDDFSVLGAAVVVNADGSYVYDPSAAPGLQALAAGESALDSFGYTVADLAGATATARVEITVTGVNDAPVAADDEASTDEDTVLTTIAVLANDSDIEGDALAIDAFDARSALGAAISLSADGTFSYDPTAAAALQQLNLGQSDVDSFTYRVSDGHGGFASATVHVTVSGVSDGLFTEESDLVDFAAVVGGLYDPESLYDALGGSDLVWLPTDAAAATAAGYDPTRVFSGGAGDDMIIGGALVDRIAGGADNDALNGRGGDDLLDGDEGVADVAVYDGARSGYRVMRSGAAIVVSDLNPGDGNDGSDTLQDIELLSFLDAIANLLAGSDADETIAGTETVDYLLASRGNDSIDAGAGDDVVVWSPGDGDDAVNGGEGNDELVVNLPAGAANSVTVTANTDGTVTVAGAGGDSFTLALDDIETLTILGEDGDDVITIGDLSGTDIADTTVFAEGGDGHDLIVAAELDKRLVADGGDGDDEIVGGAAADRLSGGAGNDVIRGNGGDDEVLGGEDTDAFVLSGPRADYTVVTDPAGTTSVHDRNLSNGDEGTDTLVGVGILRFADGDFLIDGKSGGGSTQVIASVAPGTALDYFIRFQGLAGDAEQWLHLEGFSLELLNAFDAGSGSGGAGAGRARAEDVALRLGSSDAVVELSKALVSGKALENVEVEVYRAGKAQQLIDEYQFKQVFMTELDTSGDSDATVNDLQFVFGQFSHAHVDYDATGVKQGEVRTGWDFQTNKAFDAGSASAQALKAQGEGLSTEVDLDYYVRFDGAQGWLKLEAFQMGLENSATIGSGSGGAGAGRASAEEVSLVLGGSGEIVELAEALLKGAALENVEIEAYRPGAGKDAQLVDEYWFEQAFITRVAEQDAATNEVSFAFGKFSHAHVDHDAKGGTDAGVSAGWDFIQNKAFDHGAPDADIDFLL
jgi:VCBS repeat-containing protein